MSIVCAVCAVLYLWTAGSAGNGGGSGAAPLASASTKGQDQKGNDMCEEREKRELVPKQKMEANCLEGAVVFLEWDVRVLNQSDLFVLHFKPAPCHDKP
jgi:hypothetical protein